MIFDVASSWLLHLSRFKTIYAIWHMQHENAFTCLPIHATSWQLKCVWYWWSVIECVSTAHFSMEWFILSFDSKWFFRDFTSKKYSLFTFLDYIIPMSLVCSYYWRIETDSESEWLTGYTSTTHQQQTFIHQGNTLETKFFLRNASF